MVLSLLVYMVFSILLVAAMFLVLGVVDGAKLAFREDIAYMIFFMACFGLSTIPGIKYFRSRFLKDLQDLGYFKRR
ncbi:MAG: hypothetical protein AAF530_24100 [Pseudomonadota bacterium]